MSPKRGWFGLQPPLRCDLLSRLKGNTQLAGHKINVLDGVSATMQSWSSEELKVQKVGTHKSRDAAREPMAASGQEITTTYIHTPYSPFKGPCQSFGRFYINPTFRFSDLLN